MDSQVRELVRIFAPLFCSLMVRMLGWLLAPVALVLLVSWLVSGMQTSALRGLVDALWAPVASVGSLIAILACIAWIRLTVGTIRRLRLSGITLSEFAEWPSQEKMRWMRDRGAQSAPRN